MNSSNSSQNGNGQTFQNQGNNGLQVLDINNTNSNNNYMNSNSNILHDNTNFVPQTQIWEQNQQTQIPQTWDQNQQNQFYQNQVPQTLNPIQLPQIWDQSQQNFVSQIQN